MINDPESGIPLDLAVIGAGPAGLFAARSAAGYRGDKQGNLPGITIFEKKKNPGRKLLLSGAGQCNVTHTGTPAEFLDHYGNRETTRRFMKKVLFAYPPRDLVAYLKEAGIEVSDNGEGKLFPSSGRALDILQALQNDLRRRGAVMAARRCVKALEWQNGLFHLKFEDGPSVQASRVIVATGGCSYPGTGSTGDGYAWAADLGHRIIPPRPGLTGITVKIPGLPTLAGLSFPGATMTLFRDSRKLFTGTGALLITHGGLSGPLILDSSRYIEPGDRVMVDFSGRGRQYHLDVESLLQREGGRSLANILSGPGLPRRLTDWALQRRGLDGTKKAAEVSKKEVLAVLESLTRAVFPVAGRGGWDEAMVTAGGVDLTEVDPLTLESRIVPGLYFAGEVLDIDGDTGGYNLQAAFSTGYLAGTSAASDRENPLR